MQFSLNRKRRSHKQNQCFASDSVGLIFTTSYRSTLQITTPSLSENQPLKISEKEGKTNERQQEKNKQKELAIAILFTYFSPNLWCVINITILTAFLAREGNELAKAAVKKEKKKHKLSNDPNNRYIRKEGLNRLPISTF